MHHLPRLVRLITILAGVSVATTPVANAHPQPEPAPVPAVTATPAQPGAPAVPSDAELLAAVDQLAAEALRQPGAVGISVAVARGGKVILAKGYGLAEAEHNVPADAQTMFRIGSVTKQFTAAAIMKLVEQGKLALDDPITKYLTEYPTQGNTVTIAHLLTHTSGIKSYTELPEIMEETPGLERTHEELLAAFKDVPFDFKPGEKWHYSNSGYYLLGMIIEKAAGKPYGQHLHDEFFGPLGLSRTMYDSNVTLLTNRAQGYRLVDGRIANDQALATSVPGAAGALLSTAEDLLKWNLALTSGRVVSESSYRQMTTPRVLTGGEPTEYGFGLVMDEFEGRRRISHGGGIFGFLSLLAHLPDDKLTVAVIVNSENFPPGLSDRITRTALGLAVQRLKDLPLAAVDMKRYLGEFKFQDIPLAIRFFEKDGQLFAQATDQPEIRLFHQGDHAFGAAFDENLRIVFEPPDAAKPTEPAPSLTLHQGGGTFGATRQVPVTNAAAKAEPEKR